MLREWVLVRRGRLNPIGPEADQAVSLAHPVLDAGWQPKCHRAIVRTVAMFDRRSEEEKAADASRKASEAAAAEQAKEAERWAKSPAGRAAAAKAAGDAFFQIELAVASVSGDSSFGLASTRTKHHTGHGDTLGQIEDQGWHLEHVGFVFLETGTVSTNRVMSTGQGTATKGTLTGVYLFRSTGE